MFLYIKQYPPKRFQGIRCKQDFINESPYENTVMIDTDTYIFIFSTDKNIDLVTFYYEILN